MPAHMFSKYSVGIFGAQRLVFTVSPTYRSLSSPCGDKWHGLNMWASSAIHGAIETHMKTSGLHRYLPIAWDARRREMDASADVAPPHLSERDFRLGLGIAPPDSSGSDGHPASHRACSSAVPLEGSLMSDSRGLIWGSPLVLSAVIQKRSA